MGRVRWPIFWPEISVTIILRTSLRDIAAISGLKCLKPHFLDVWISAKGFDAVNLGEGAGIRLQHLSRNTHYDRMPIVSAELFPTSIPDNAWGRLAGFLIPVMRRLINANYTTFLVRQAFKAFQGWAFWTYARSLHCKMYPKPYLRLNKFTQGKLTITALIQ